MSDFFQQSVRMSKQKRRLFATFPTVFSDSRIHFLYRNPMSVIAEPYILLSVIVNSPFVMLSVAKHLLK